MLSFINKQDLLCPLQSGFRPQHSCVTALIKVSDDIRCAIDRDLLSFLVLLDFTKAFDSVDHITLIHKLSSQFLFTDSACKLIWTYLRGRMQKVFSNGLYSTFLDVHTGVPQGSILGPLLFSIYINDLPTCIKNCSFHMYADDVQLYISRPLGLVEDAVHRLNEDISSINDWALDNKLLLNASKSELIVIYRESIDTTDFPDILLNGIKIPYKDTVRNLGIIFTKTLSWSHQVKSVVSRIYGGLRRLWLSAPFTPLETRMMLVRSLLLPLFIYGCEIFCRLDSDSQRKLNIAFNSAARYIYNIRRFDHVSAYANSVVGCPILKYIDFRTILLLRNIIKHRTPKYLFDKISFAQSQRTSSLIVPQFRYRITERQFFVQGIRMWNALPTEIRRGCGGSRFRENIFQFLS